MIKHAAWDKAVLVVCLQRGAGAGAGAGEIPGMAQALCKSQLARLAGASRFLLTGVIQCGKI